MLFLVGPVRAVPAHGQKPDGRWRTLHTEHFRVTFPDGMELLGREAGARAETAWGRLSEHLADPPGGTIDLLLTDHADVSSGRARVAPDPRIVIHTRPPVDGFALSYFEDWLDVVITHELAHIFHLDVAGPLGRALRYVFGRPPSVWPFFPNRGAPGWTVEGLATWYESGLTGSGRVLGTVHDMVVRTAVLEGRFEGVDQASGQSPVWPAGDRPYVYGSLFFEHLLDRYGPDRMEAFVEAVGGQIVPYRMNAAARTAFGVTFSDAWEEWRADLERDVAELRRRRTGRAPLTVPEPVTTEARRALYPAVDPSGGRLAYFRSDGRSDPQIRLADPDGGGSRGLTRTNGTAPLAWTPDGDVVFAQLERDGPYRLRSDLYRATPGGGVRRITRNARVDQPSVTPGGTHALAVQNGEGTTRLVEVELARGDVRPLGAFEPGVHWAYPSVSPDGRWIAASRWAGRAGFDVVVLDREGRVVVEVTDSRAMDLAPAWSPDGRWLVWSSDRSGLPELMAARLELAAGPAAPEVAEVRQITNLLTGALFPSVDPESCWVHFSAYHADGWEVERIPFDPDSWFEPFAPAPRFQGGGSAPGSAAADLAASDLAAARLAAAELGPAELGMAEAAEGEAAGADSPVEPYSPWPTLVPRFWEPVIAPPESSFGRDVVGRSYGARTRVSDLVGRHTVVAEARLSAPAARLSGGVGYSWAGLGNPVVGLSASQAWDAAGPLTGELEEGSEERLWLAEREQSLDLNATLLLPSFRHALSLRVGAGMVREERTLLDDDLQQSTRFRLNRPRSRLARLQAQVSFSTARGHAFSVGPERGASLFLLGRLRRELDLADSLRAVAGRDRSTRDVLGRLLLFRDLPGPGHTDHVLGFRASAGAAGGPGADRFHFDVGGASGRTESLTGLSLFGGRSRFLPARGYVGGERSGRYAWSASGEYRFPLALVHRGLGLFPLHLDRLSGALFVDAADAWGPDLDLPGYRNPRRADVLASAGAELWARLLPLFSVPLTLRGGFAVRMDGGGTGFHLVLGRSF